MLLSATEIADATKGSLRESSLDAATCMADAITWDSREVAPGCAFLALPGERVDGHDFADTAIDAGATVLIVSRSVDDAVARHAESRGCCIVEVADSATALRHLAAEWRRRLHGRVIALTGSAGKTTTKNFTAAVLSTTVSTVATRANMNNELGVPRTILSADIDTEAVVVEMGMRGAGQLADLCSYVQPDMALVVNVGDSHIELLGSRQAIADAKAEPVASVVASGTTVFLNAADEATDRIMRVAGLPADGIELVFFDGSGSASAAHDATFRARDISTDGAGRASFTLVAPDGEAPCHLGIPGVHNVVDAVAAAAVGHSFGVTVADAARALSAMAAAAGRGRLIDTSDGFTVIDDAYNANPASMAAALASLASMDAAGRKIAVLGDMGELGDTSSVAHTELGTAAAHAGIDSLVCVGRLAAETAASARGEGLADVITVDDADAALAAVRPQLHAGDIVLVKASHAIGLESLVEGLMD